MNNALVIDAKKGAVFVTDLFWQTLPPESKTKVEAKKLADELDLPDGAIHTADVTQVGLVTLEQAKGKFYSLALAVVQAIPQRSFISVTALSDDVFAYIACRDGALLPTGDMTGSKEVVQDRLESDLALMTDTVVYGPSDWSLASKGEITIASLKELSINKDWLIIGISHPSNGINTKLVVFVVIAAILGGGGYWYKLKLDKEALIAKRQQQALIAQQSLNHTPWMEMPSAQLVVNKCIEAIFTLPLSPGGWTSESFSCDGVSVNASWKVEPYTTIAGFQAEYSDAMFDGLGKTAQASVQVELGDDNYERTKDVPTLRDRRNELLSIAQSLNTVITFNPVAAPVPRPLPDGTVIAGPGWTNLTWRLTSTLNPESLISMLNGRGFVLNKITLNLTNNSPEWVMEGGQYVY